MYEGKRGETGKLVLNENVLFQNRGKAFLVLFAGVGSLLDFNHLRRLQHDETMSPMSQQNYVARKENATFQIGTVTRGINIHAHFA